jgi:hypothetical protein
MKPSIFIFFRLCLLLPCTGFLFPSAAQVPDAAQNQMPSKAFERLLYRLDHAPVDLRVVSQSARRGQQMQQSAANLAQASSKVTPLLNTIASNRTLALLSRVPLAGRPARWAKDTSTSLANLNRDFTRLVEMDRRHLQPLRQAALDGDRLRQTRRRADLPRAVQSFEAAARILQDDENRVHRQHQKLTALASSVKQWAPHLEKRLATSPQKTAAWGRFKSALQVSQKSLNARLGQLSTLRRFATDCAREGQEAMKS